MRTTIPAAFPGYEPCDKIPGSFVDAYTDIKLDPKNPTGIILDTTWGEVRLDLKTIVKAGETITHLELAPETDPTVIRYTNEAGEYECISGDELSRIVSLQLLKDVDQTTPPEDGDCYVYNANTGLFETFPLSTTIGDLNTTINRLQAQITALNNRLTVVEEKLTPPEGAPSDVKVAFGKINLYSDKNAVVTDQGVVTALDKTHGIYTHALSTDVYGDRIAG